MAQVRACVFFVSARKPGSSSLRYISVRKPSSSVLPCQWTMVIWSTNRLLGYVSNAVGCTTRLKSCIMARLASHHIQIPGCSTRLHPSVHGALSMGKRKASSGVCRHLPGFRVSTCMDTRNVKAITSSIWGPHRSRDADNAIHMAMGDLIVGPGCVEDALRTGVHRNRAASKAALVGVQADERRNCASIVTSR